LLYEADLRYNFTLHLLDLPTPARLPSTETPAMNAEDTTIMVDICDQQLVLHQSRKSFNCGSTLWSAGLVLAR